MPGYGGAPGYGYAPPGQPPPTYSAWAWIATIGGVLFSLILGFPSGLVALNYARKARRSWETGDQPAAASASRKARTWAIVSTALDVLGIVLLVVVIGSSGSSSGLGSSSVIAAFAHSAQSFLAH